MSSRWLREPRRGKAVELAEPTESERLARPLGQGPALERWVAAARRLNLPHGLVVEGSRGVGKSLVMRWLTAALLCPSELDPEQPCGMCRVCTLVANDQHPDVHLLRLAQDLAEKAERKTSFYVIKVGQVREVQERLQRRAVEGRARVCLIADADCLEEEGQNALLKTLEEPGVATFLLLEAGRPELLLPTVRSRVQRLQVLPLPDAELQRALGNRIPQHSHRFDDLVRLAHGSLGAALSAATEQAVQLHDLVRSWLGQANNLRPVATARAVLEGASDRHLEIGQARQFLGLLRAELRRQRDALVSAEDASYPARTLEPWTTWLERTLQAERDLDLLIPPEQVLTACLLQLMA